MKYIEFINQKLRERLLTLEEPICIYGQNVSAGSCIGGLAKNLKVKNGQIINTPNSELTLCGVGMGLMINGVHALFIMKQLDFLLLGLDQLTHSWNVLKHRKNLVSFTVLTVITDSGLEGPQSCFQRFHDLVRCADIIGLRIPTSTRPLKDIDFAINNYMFQPGLKVIVVTQSFLQKEVE